MHKIESFLLFFQCIRSLIHFHSRRKLSILRKLSAYIEAGHLLGESFKGIRIGGKRRKVRMYEHRTDIEAAKADK